MPLKIVEAKPYMQKVYYFVGELSEVKAWSKSKMEPEELDGLLDTMDGAGAYTTKINISGKPNVMVWIPSIENKKYLWHETLHAAFCILNTAGVSANYDEQEALAYLQGQLVEDLERRFKK